MKSIKLLLPVILLVYTLGQFSSDLYLSSLPIISRELNTTANNVQLSISLFMLGFCISQIFYGPFSDALGRKLPLIVGLLICLIGSIMCVFAHKIGILLIGRFLQGLGGGAGASLAIAIIRDLVEGKELAKIQSYFVVVSVFIVTTAPLIGSYILYFFYWRANFILLFLIDIMALIGTIFLLPETNRHKDYTNLHPMQILNNMLKLIRSKSFIGFSICRFAAYAGVISWLTSCPILLHSMGFSPVLVGWVTIISGFSYVSGGFFNSKVVVKFGIINMIKIGSIIFFVSGTSLLYVGWMNMEGLALIICPVALFMFGGGLIGPSAYAGAIQPFPEIAGITVATVTFFQLGGGFLSSFIISLFSSSNIIPLALCLLGCALIVIVCLSFLIKTGDKELLS